MYSGMMSTAKRSPTRFGVVNLPASAIARMSCKPVSPLIGREPSRTNFMPL